MKVNVGGVAINYVLEGPESAPMMTMGHSIGANLSMWDFQAAVLRRRYRILRYDARGHGDSDAPEPPYSLEQLVEELRGLLETLGVRRTHFIGASLGGIVAQAFAVKYPDVLESLVLANTTSRMVSSEMPSNIEEFWRDRLRTVEAHGIQAVVQSVLERWFTPAFLAQPSETLEPIRKMVLTTKPKGYIGCFQAIAHLDLTDSVHRIKVPTLLIAGDKDGATPLAVFGKMQKEIAGAELVVLKGASHMSNLEQPEEFTEAVTTFLAMRRA